MESAAIPFSTAMKETSKGEGLVYVTSIAVHGRERRRDDARVLTVTVSAA